MDLLTHLSHILHLLITGQVLALAFIHISDPLELPLSLVDPQLLYCQDCFSIDCTFH